MKLSLGNSLPSPDAPNYAIEVVECCLASLIRCQASDLHLQPRREHWDVACRVDGVMQPMGQIPKSASSDPTARLMALANLPSYHAGTPQEGPLAWTDSSKQTHEIRLGIFPTVHGNRAVLRVVNSQRVRADLNQLGFDSGTLEQLQNVCQSRDGCLLIAGPAGSGKTTTLYACLSQISTGPTQRSVLTIEDPVEAVIDSISQSQIQASSGMTLAAAMRAAVRQDAEVLLVSEIRDGETAEAVISASMTGHLCFSSIHAGSIGTTLRRLAQMKLPDFALQSGLRGILCQRLLRVCCHACRQSSKSSPDPNCQSCLGTGYSGRVPIAQMATLSGTELGQQVFNALADGKSSAQIDQLIQNAGLASLRQSAQQLIDRERTDQAEVFRVLGAA